MTWGTEKEGAWQPKKRPYVCMFVNLLVDKQVSLCYNGCVRDKYAALLHTRKELMALAKEKQATVITVNVQKGGVGKSTTAHELASNLTRMGHKVLVIDLDPQQNLSKFSGAPLTEYWTIYEVLKGECDFVDAIHYREDEDNEVHNYDVCTAHKKLEDAEKEFSEFYDVYKLTDALKAVRSRYDFIIIDTPPKLGILPNMALTAADYVVVPVEASSAGIQGIGQLFERIDRITNPERGSNKHLKVAGMLLTKYADRTKLEKSIRRQLGDVAARMNARIFKTTIREAVAIKEAQALKQSILEHEPKSKPCLDYISFTKELLEVIEYNG